MSNFTNLPASDLPTPVGRIRILKTPDKKGKNTMLLLFDQEAQQTDEFKHMVSQLNLASQDKFRKDYLDMGFKPFKTADDSKWVDVDHVGVNLSSKWDPTIYAPDLKTKLDWDDLYQGVHVRVQYKPMAYEVDGNRGVTLQMANMIQKVRDDERYQGGDSDPEGLFSPVAAADFPAAQDEEAGTRF